MAQYKGDVKHSDRLYELRSERSVRMSDLEHKVKKASGMTFSPVLVTKKSALSRRNMEAIGKDL